MKDHVIVAGYGVGGRLLAQALKEANLPFIIIELNSEAVREGRAAGLPIYYGDVTSDEALSHAHLADAHALVLVISDSDAARQALSVAKQLAPKVPVIVRARRVTEEASLKQLGASDVIMEELEAGIEVLARVLRSKGAPVNVLGAFISRVRDQMGKSVRDASLPRNRVADLQGLDELKVESMLLLEGAAASGKTLAMLEVRRRTGASVLAVRRDNKLLENLDAHTELRAGDLLFLAGPRDGIYRAVALLDGRGQDGGVPSASDALVGDNR